MKYKFDIDVQEKPEKKAFLVRSPEPVYREFVHATKERGISMTSVIVEMMRQFSAEFRNKGRGK
jgi:hypothetical protein